VPFFLFGRNALAEGIGERLTALDLPPAWYLVLVPQVSVSTRETFAYALTSGGRTISSRWWPAGIPKWRRCSRG
jgi:4-diphosphocytidyl-2C-methyl-D-erythritol kinase